MPTYDYKCKEHGYFEKFQKIADGARADCPTCNDSCPKVIIKAPALGETAMAFNDMPGSIAKQQDRMEKQHRSVDQAYRSAGN